MTENEQLYEKVGNYTKFKLIEMLIEKHKDTKLHSFKSIEKLADDVCNVLSIAGLKFYTELKEDFNE